MSSRRSILEPVSLKAKRATKQKSTTQPDGKDKKTATATDSKPKGGKVRKKKSSSGMGMFGSWFNDPPDYDEEEDSKNWEQPWSLPPAGCSLRSFEPAPSVTRVNDELEKSRAVEDPMQKKPTEKPARQSKTSETRDVSSGSAKQASNTKPKNGGRNAKAASTPAANPFRASSPAPPASSAFFRLPLEVRDKIYGHLLTAPTPITVLRGWTQCYVRYRGGLEPNILLACRQTYEEGIRILYSSNTFMYLIRDAGDPIPEALRPEGYVSPLALPLEPPPLAELKSANNTKGRAPKRQKKAKPAAKKSTVGDVNRVIYLAKYAHLLRRVEIVLESNRDKETYGLAMAKAIQLLGTGEGGVGANLTSLQFSLTPLEMTTRGPPDTTAWTVIPFFATPQANVPDTDAVVTPTTGKKSKPKPKPKKPEEDHPVMTALRSLSVRLLHFTVYTPSSRRLDMTLDMTYRTATATDPNNSLGSNLLARDDLISRQRAETATASAEAFDNLRGLIRQACEDTDAAVESGWWTEYGPPQVAAVRSGMEGIETINARVRKYRTPWYEKLRDEYVAQPEHACCVRKVGRRLVKGTE
ncbi:hypothetical protein GE09DRAFT_1187774 [Coniochaeta sp. 2T2.1]|nr:hypothetical protein GE09DRAFT_1187774 [Coniochaeta sp. 2T2.1]